MACRQRIAKQLQRDDRLTTVPCAALGLPHTVEEIGEELDLVSICIIGNGNSETELGGSLTCWKIRYGGEYKYCNENATHDELRE